MPPDLMLTEVDEYLEIYTMFHLRARKSTRLWRVSACRHSGMCFWGRSFSLISASPPISFCSFNLTGIDSFQKHDQVGSLDLDGLVFTIDEADIWESECSDFEPLGKDRPAVQIPPQCFDEVSSTASEEKQVTRVGVLANYILSQLEQTIE